MLFKKGNNPFGEVIQAPNAVGHAVSVIGSNYATPEEFFEGVEELHITLMLDHRKFRQHLVFAGHFWVRIDADVETTFAVNEPDYPLGL
jgi:hypothetical protein